MAHELGEVLRTDLGLYAIYAPVASGGFGTAYFGRDLKTNRAVAIKRLHGHLVVNWRTNTNPTGGWRAYPVGF
jgi:hypothetical protein